MTIQSFRTLENKGATSIAASPVKEGKGQAISVTPSFPGRCHTALGAIISAMPSALFALVIFQIGFYIYA
jgi:hypothetical protein